MLSKLDLQKPVPIVKESDSWSHKGEGGWFEGFRYLFAS